MRKMKGLLRSWSLVAITAAATGLLAGASPAGATELDLTTVGSSGEINGALFVQMDEQPTGSDHISFVRVRDNAPVVEGYNTSARPLEFDEIDDLTHTHDLLLADVPIVTINGVAYRQFGLDDNQTGANPDISLDALQLFVSATGNQTGFPNVGTLVYDLDAGGDNWVHIDYSLNAGSGSGDVWFYAPDSLFAGATYVTLYSRFGENFGNNDGYEEWFVRGASTPPPIPEPATMLIFGAGLVATLRRKVAGWKLSA